MVKNLHNIPVFYTSETFTTLNLLKSILFFFSQRPHSGNRHRRRLFHKRDFSFAKPKVVVNHENESQKNYEGVNENEENIKEVSVGYTNKEEVDLNYLAREGDGAYEVELASMTEGMSMVELVGFMKSFQGHCSDRSKLVDAGEIEKVLPENWKIELALRHLAGLPSLFCRSYVSPSGEHFKSCKDVAYFLRNQSSIDVAGPSKEGEIRQMKNGSHMFFKSLKEVAGSSANEANIETNDLYDVEVVSRFDCPPCGRMFEDIAELKNHLGTFHKKTTRTFNLPPNEGSRPCTLVKHQQHVVMDGNEPQFGNGCALQNGHASSSSQERAETREAVPTINANVDGNGRFKTKCTWCFKEFISEPVDVETMAEAVGFLCPRCKEKLWGGFEKSLLRSCKR